MQLATIQELARYWANDYDWRKAEALTQFVTKIDGVDIHIIHVNSPHKNAFATELQQRSDCCAERSST